MGGETIGVRIETIARAKNMPTGAKLAERFGVSYETLRKWKAGLTAPNRTRAAMIAKVLGVPKDQFMAEAVLAAALSSGEENLLRKYRALDEIGRVRVEAFVDGVAPAQDVSRKLPSASR